MGNNECDLPSILTLIQEISEGGSMSNTKPLIGLARFSLKGSDDPYDNLDNPTIDLSTKSYMNSA
jgi:hypothetical protein